MNKLWVVLLGLIASPVWAQDNGLMAGPTVVHTPLATVSSVSTMSQTPSTPLPTPLDTPALSFTPVGTPNALSTVVSPAGTPSVSVSATPTPLLPKPPAMTMTSLTPEPTSGGERFVFQFNAGVVPAISSAAATQLGTGLDLEAKLSYAFDDFFSIGLETGYYDMAFTPKALTGFGLPSGTTADMSHIPVLVVFQIGLGDEGGPVQPYLILGAGLGIDAYNVQDAAFPPAGGANSWVNFELDPGLGVAFPLSKGVNLFVQGKVVMDFDNNGGSTQSNTSELADTPIIFTPIQAGLNFNL